MPQPRFIQKLMSSIEARPGPLILVSAPRAGAAQLSHILAQADRAQLIGLETRAYIETTIAPYRVMESDRLLAAAATPAISQCLHELLNPKPNSWMVDQAGTNALRIPFLAAAFPEARFVMVTRDPHEQIAETAAAWRSERFITYPHLIGWEQPWSFALIPEWQKLHGKSIAEIALTQWATITTTLLDDLAMMPDERWFMVSYESLQSDIRRAIEPFQALHLHWRRQPRMLHTRTIRDDLYLADRAVIDTLLPQIDDLLQRLHTTKRAQELHRKETPRRSVRLPAPVRRNLVRGAVATALLGGALPTAQTALAATFIVTNLNDSGAGSLRQAIVDANGVAGADTITFQPGLTGTITLTSGQLKVTDSVDIQGPGANVLSVSGNNSSRVFYLYNSSTNLAVTISGLTVTGGNTTIGGGIVNFDEDLTLDSVTITGNNSTGDGGGLWADGFNMDLTIRNSIISGNTSASDGGGIYVEDTGGPLLIQNSQITGNTAADDGGGIYFYDPDQSLTIETSTISGNTAGDAGGGIYLYDTDGGSLTIQTTTIATNTASRGGGLFLYGPDNPVVIQNTTISGNQATSGDGGGVYIYTPNAVNIGHSTIVNNSATGQGGGIIIHQSGTSISHTIIANNTASTDADINTPGINLGFSLIETPGAAIITDAGGNIFNQDPQLAPLANNGGPTQTHLPASTSPVINAGDPAFAPPPTTDQRGENRVIGNSIDIGAVEINSGTVELTISSLSVNEQDGSAIITVSRSGGSDNAATVDYTTADGSANAGTDYTATSGTLSWANGDNTPKTITIPIVNDSAVEPDESFTLSLTNATGATLGSPAQATITIVNDDAPAGTLAFTASSLSINENSGTATLTVTRTGGSSGAATVDYTTADGSANAGTDYTATSGTLSWANGDNTPKTITVPIVDDSAVEPDESFTLSLTNATGATLGSPAQATITIVNDDAPAGMLAFTASSLSINENSGTATLTVTRTGGSSGAATVDYTTADGSANAGTDYTATSGTLSWANGDNTPKTITIPIVDDSAVEPDESFTLSLTNATGATLGSPAFVSITIIDDDKPASVHQLFLPLVAVTQQADLVVTQVLLNPNKMHFTAGEQVEIAVTITNQGTINTVPFWVDLYLEPSEEPAVNKRWNMLCKLQPCYGIAWGVVQSLAPGQSVTLTSVLNDFDKQYSNWNGSFASKTTRMVVLADSYNPAKPTGTVSESDETNNSRSVALNVAESNTSITDRSNPTTIPERPTLP